jgi:hypothetical protein
MRYKTRIMLTVTCLQVFKAASDHFVVLLVKIVFRKNNTCLRGRREYSKFLRRVLKEGFQSDRLEMERRRSIVWVNRIVPQCAFSLKMEAAYSFETLVIITTQKTIICICSRSLNLCEILRLIPLWNHTSNLRL